MSDILNLVSQYGYILVYLLLSIELLGVPFLPGEILMVYCGFLVFQGKLNIILLCTVATLGVSTGLTLSYFIGHKLGEPFFSKYGPKIHLGPDKMDKMSKLLDKYGTMLIFFICFIPGLKHIIGYFSGTSGMSFKRYAIGGYLGATLWAITFATIGDLLGSNWSQFHTYIIKYLVIGAIILVTLLIAFYIIKIYKNQIIKFIKNTVLTLLNTFHSLGKIRIVVLLAAISCILLVDAFVNIIQGLLSDEFAPFNQITYYIVQKIFANSVIFNPIFKIISFLELNIMYVIMSIIIIIFLIYKSANKKIEIRYTLITFLGGFILQKLLIYVFNFLSSYFKIFSNIFNINCFNIIIIYGFLFYLIIRSLNSKWTSRFLILFFLFIGLLTGIAQLFFGNTLSEILAGYSLGGAWLTLNIILLEVNKILPDSKSE
ncbi:MAG: VTT domain-containing protein [Sarcina sp.]